MVRVPSLGVRHAKPSHVFGKIAIATRPEHEVPMIGHQAVAQEPHRHPLACRLENLLKRLIVGRLSKDLVPSHGAIEHVEYQATSRHTFSPGHGGNLSNPFAQVNKNTPDPWYVVFTR